jgi:glutaredoxin
MEIKEEFESQNTTYIILSKSKCKYCDLSKDLLENKELEFSTINCDKYLMAQRDKNKFLEDMCNIIGHEYMMFPMIFKDKKFVGGFNELNESLKN